ncbi:MAG: transposase [Desulfovibrio sp.]
MDVSDDFLQYIPQEILEICKDDQASRDLLLSFCHSSGAKPCPRCGNLKHYSLSGNRYRCSSCRYTFKDFSGRFINSGNLPPAGWIVILHLFIHSVPTGQAAKKLGVSYNTAFKAYHAIRFSILAKALDADRFIGDRTGLLSFVKNGKLTGGPKSSFKRLPVYGIFRRHKWVFIDVVPQLDGATLYKRNKTHGVKLVAHGPVIHSDRYGEYDALLFCNDGSLDPDAIVEYEHATYVDRGDHEFWVFALPYFRKLKGLTPQRFPLYLKELEFKFNTTTSERFETLLNYLCAFIPLPEDG